MSLEYTEKQIAIKIFLQVDCVDYVFYVAVLSKNWSDLPVSWSLV